MDRIIIFYCFFIVSVSSLQPADRSVHFDNVVRLMPERRRSNSLWAPIAKPAAYVPRVGGIHPGHTLLKPKKRTLQSAAKYPKNAYDHLVYGNHDNLDALYLNYMNKMNNKVIGLKHSNKAYYKPYKPIKIRLGVDKGKSHVPRTGGLHPGHALLKPKGRTLESAANYPKDNLDHLVYGNRENFGITYNKTNQRVLFTGFRKMNDDTVDNILLDAIRNLRYYQERKRRQENKGPKQRDRDEVIVIAMEPGSGEIMDETAESSEEESHAGEIMDLRRAVINKHKRDRRKDHVSIERQDKYALSSDASAETVSTDSTSKSGEYEKNPGNQYTLHKNRYKQNWLWNHFMDGDHMNINPYGPQMNNVGPTGVDLFFGRKWWYFNQDDYRPLRRK